MARIYWVKVNGRKLYSQTLAPVRAVAQRLADQLRKAVTVGYDDVDPPNPARRVMRANPLNSYYSAMHLARHRSTEMHAPAAAAKKARKVAKHGRGRPGTAPPAAGKVRYQIDATGRRDAYVLYRSSKAAAEALGREFASAGYKVTVRAV